MLPDLNSMLYGDDDLSEDIIWNYIEMCPDNLTSFSQLTDYLCVYCGLSV